MGRGFIPRTIYDQLGWSFDPLPLAYYTIMDRCSTRVRVVISALLIVGVIRSQTLPGHTEPYDFFVVALQFAVAGTLGILSRTRRAYLQAVETRAEHAEAERDRQVALAAAEERTRIARELHDVVAHHFSLMAVQSEAAAALLPARPAEAGQGRGDHRPDSPGGPDRSSSASARRSGILHPGRGNSRPSDADGSPGRSVAAWRHLRVPQHPMVHKPRQMFSFSCCRRGELPGQLRRGRKRGNGTCLSRPSS
jgi:Histidine kinase